MADPKDFENDVQTSQPEVTNDALQEEREKQKKEEKKQRERNIVERNEKGEIAPNNSYVESFLQFLKNIAGAIKSTINPYYESDLKEQAKNQGTRAGGRFQNSTVDVEDLKDIFENTHFEYDDSFIQKVKNVKPSYDILASRASRGDREAYQSLLKQLGDKEAADRLVEKYRDNNNEQPQKITDFEK